MVYNVAAIMWIIWKVLDSTTLMVQLQLRPVQKYENKLKTLGMSPTPKKPISYIAILLEDNATTYSIFKILFN